MADRVDMQYIQRILKTHHRRNHTKFTREQLKSLINVFNYEPYPNYTTRQKLALEINMEESRIQIWFQNRRARHLFEKRSKPNEALKSSQERRQDNPEERSQVRRCHTYYNTSQLCTLKKAFKNNPYPGIECREQLAKEIGVPELRIQVWFQNRISRLLSQVKEDPEETTDSETEKQESRVLKPHEMR
ncbi:PREDICTED: double homeobox protein A-like [Chrysochloris asiatica]|uniref:Double homeobox protein A-like n=1 Tax=Chrysochloris asiatica TaxID=185453 RepID=A0A9B0X0F9_CHRAS|nr:PREDICTED: double homeobox protein A-like [Chrysochloris asiatica]